MKVLEKEVHRLLSVVVQNPTADHRLAILVRKGESLANLGGMLCGFNDPGLTILGRKQANLLFTGLHKHYPSFEGVYSSDLKRSTSFADIATGFKGRSLVKVDQRLRELNFGDVAHVLPSA